MGENETTSGNGSAGDTAVDDAEVGIGQWSDVPAEWREIVFSILRLRIAECEARITEGQLAKSPLAATGVAHVLDLVPPETFSETEQQQMFDCLGKISNHETWTWMLERRGLLSAIAELGGEVGSDPDVLPWDLVASEVRMLVTVILNEAALEQQRVNLRHTLQTTIAQEGFQDLAVFVAATGNPALAAGFQSGAIATSTAGLENEVVVAVVITAASEYLDLLSERLDDEQA